jgi:hypothetical protein
MYAPFGIYHPGLPAIKKAGLFSTAGTMGFQKAALGKEAFVLWYIKTI